MRKQFFKTLCKLAEKDKDIIFLTGDLGYSFFEEFQKRFPKQFINCGVIEQSMVGIAAGLALAGKKPYVYSGIPFLVFRAYEQIRNDVCFNNLDVKLIGTFSSGFLGFTHNLDLPEHEEDLLKRLPNLQTYYPRNEKDLETFLIKSHKTNQPTYLRV